MVFLLPTTSWYVPPTLCIISLLLAEILFLCIVSNLSAAKHHVSNSPFLLLEPHTFPSLALFVQKMLPFLAPERPTQAGCGSDKHCFPAVLTYGALVARGASAPGQDPFMPSPAQTLDKTSVMNPLTTCLKGSTHDNAVPHHVWYYL